MNIDNKLIYNQLEEISNSINSLNRLLKKYLKEDENTFRCNKCNSSFVYVRRKDNKLLCRKCGNMEKVTLEDNE